MTRDTGKFWGFVGRFTIVHTIVYIVVAAVFLASRDALSPASQTALEVFKPYRPIGLVAMSGQVLRSIVLALVLYPFYDRIVRNKRGIWVLFGALWGISILGSVEPMPGSIEGMIYTEIPLQTHLILLAVAAIEVFLSAWIILFWERRSNGDADHEPQNVDQGLFGFSLRFTLLHVVTYAVVGILLFVLQNYEEAFAIQGRFELYRPLDDPIVTAAVPLQIIRGTALALFFYPFYGTFVSKKQGWLLLFGLTFGLIALGGPNFLTGVLTDILSRTPFAEFLVGPVEITVQMFVFSVLLFAWERRRNSKRKGNEND